MLTSLGYLSPFCPLGRRIAIATSVVGAQALPPRLRNFSGFAVGVQVAVAGQPPRKLAIARHAPPSGGHSAYFPSMQWGTVAIRIHVDPMRIICRVRLRCFMPTLLATILLPACKLRVRVQHEADMRQYTRGLARAVNRGWRFWSQLHWRTDYLYRGSPAV